MDPESFPTKYFFSAVSEVLAFRLGFRGPPMFHCKIVFVLELFDELGLGVQFPS